MPPYVPRKRIRGDTPPGRTEPEDGQRRSPKALTAPPRKSTLFDDLDATSTPRSSTKNGSSSLLIGDSEDDESSLTSLSDADFEDVPAPKRQKVHEFAKGEDDDDDDDDDDNDDIEFEDVETPSVAQPDIPTPSGDLELTLIRDTRISLANALGKKGPSKRERQIRVATHCMHVPLLLWHNAIRNAWLCDPLVQGIMLSHLPPRLWNEVDRWKKNSGLEIPGETPRRGKTKRDLKGKGRASAPSSRDWSDASQRLEKGAVDMSHGDPLFRLMKSLAAWWKQRFRITAPGLRKWGYMPLERLDRLTKAFKQGGHDQDRFGERIRNLDEFRKHAQECAGSRDVGAQLFTALLRALGLEARLVANLQPLGFGWNKLEEADPEKEGFGSYQSPQKEPEAVAEDGAAAEKAAKSRAPGRASKRSARSARLKDPSDDELMADDSDDDLAIQVPQAPQKKGRIYDADLEFPHYWTEVLSPVTNKYLPVDPIVKAVVATNRELVESLEPRGGKADKAKQVMAYVVGYSQDGTAKDVTVRYLKRQMLPGRTKGMRMPVEKVPVYNRHGKVKRYDQFDWFKSVMRGYVRGDRSHPITEVDEEEDSTDLKPAKLEKKEVKDGGETLQYYKQSKEFVLERHLKREEALLPTARPVKTFKNKSKGAHPQEEPVYSRKDVVLVKSAETWHKQGRAPIPGEEPLKRVPYRAATTNRRREIAEAEAATGEKVLQGLYSFDQTDWIIPPPIQNGVIPKNEYGNIDMFVEHMCPEGAVHVPYRGAMRAAKRLGIDFAEAVVDFEFGHRMAVPVIQGVVIAEEHYDRVMEELAKDGAEKKRKEDEKRRKAALAMWRKFIMGMRILERIKQDYGEVREDVDVFGRGSGGRLLVERGMQDAGADPAEDRDTAGGFLPEGYEEDDDKTGNLTSGFFPVVDDEDDGGEDALEVDHGEGANMVSESPTTDRRYPADDESRSLMGQHISIPFANVGRRTPDEVSPMAPDGGLSKCEEAILSCFPDICLDYLRSEAARYEWDSERLMDHILDQQEKGFPYPRANILKRKRPEKDEQDEHAEMRRKVEIGDPRHANKGFDYVKHYTNATRKLLKAAFPQRYAEDIDKLIKDNDYRLYTTYQILDEAGWNTEARPMRVKKSISRRVQPGAELRNSAIEAEKDALAEFDAVSADCRVKADARAAKKAEQEQKEREEAENLERARAEGSVTDCGCCFDEFALNRMVHCNGTVIHWFCYGCARRMAETVIGLSRYQLDCMSMDGCDGTFAKDQKELFLDGNLTTALDRIEQEAVLRMAGIENLATCPFCPYAAEYPPVEVNKEFRCENPDCGSVSCRLCRQETHIPKTCDEAASERGQTARRAIEEAMSAALIRNCNKCKIILLPHCGTPFIKENGCNKMMCTRPGCGNMQCYVCSQSCRDYSHFNDSSRGGKAGNCPLFDNVEQRHATEVQAAEERARQKIAEENPDVDAELLEIKFSESVKKDDEVRKTIIMLHRSVVDKHNPGYRILPQSSLSSRRYRLSNHAPSS
ncbi:hypothetical protein C8A03DRAFT_44770 [Achaetomium macrosporum]|uniref:RING-type domain-containing protein n=1 Tax=Achaetomium macrosporum TaxID=79813 RepID=A0AAN7C9N1_9PEZI|nr:hypothetical protein C8A03DRAFT_44770 [Achaetomium macrosporum]